MKTESGGASTTNTNAEHLWVMRQRAARRVARKGKCNEEEQCNSKTKTLSHDNSLLRLIPHLKAFLLRSFNSHHSPNDYPKMPELFRRPARKQGRNITRPTGFRGWLKGGEKDPRRPGKLIDWPQIFCSDLLDVLWSRPDIRLEANVPSTQFGPVQPPTIISGGRTRTVYCLVHARN